MCWTCRTPKETLQWSARTGWSTYNPNGRTVEEIRHNFYNVEAVCHRAQTLLYDAGGNDLTVYSGSDPVFEAELRADHLLRRSQRGRGTGSGHPVGYPHLDGDSVQLCL